VVLKMKNENARLEMSIKCDSVPLRAGEEETL